MECRGSHQGFILAACFDDAGQRLYSGSVEGNVDAWDFSDAAAPTLIGSWSLHRGPINALCWGQGQLVSAGFDGRVRFVDPESGQSVGGFYITTGGVHGVAVSEEHVAAACFDARIVLANRRGRIGDALVGHQDTVTCIAFLNGQRLVSGSRDHTLRLWDIASRSELAVASGHQAWVTKVVPVATDRVVSVGEDGLLLLWAIADDTLVELGRVQADPYVAWGLAATAERAWVGGATGVHSVGLDPSFEVRREVAAGEFTARGLAVSGVTGMVAYGSDAAEIRVPSGEDVHQLSGVSARLMSGIADGELFVGGTTTGRLLLNPGRDGEAEIGRFDAPVYCLRRISAEEFVSSSFTGAIDRRSCATGEVLASMDHQGQVFSLATAQAGPVMGGRTERSFLLSAGEDAIRLWDLATSAQVWAAEAVGSGTHCMACIDSRGESIVLVGEDGKLRLWRHDGEAVIEVADWALSDLPSAVECVPGEHAVVVGYANGWSEYVDLASRVARKLHGDHEDWVRTVRISTDGQRVLTVSQNGTGRVCDLHSGEIVSNVTDAPVAAADFEIGSDQPWRVRWIDCQGVSH